MSRRRPVTAKMAEQCLVMLNLRPVPASTIRTWAERGDVRTYGKDGFNCQQYELRDIINKVRAA